MTYITITLEWPIPYKLENRKNSMPKEKTKNISEEN